ncbi:MAG TPA: phage minor head protein [Kofleriaceae bacterium]|nr:phage minor head protein [Kofleriaceae bacterium]
MIDWLRDQNSIDAIEAALQRHDYAAVLQAVDDAALKFAAETHASYVHSAQTAATWLDNQPATADSLVRFDQTDPAVIQAARQNQLEWVRDMTFETRQVVRQTISDGTQRGAHPLEIARDVRDSIGLTAQQEAAVRSYRRALESQDYSNALDRQLSSGHSDRTIAAAQDAGRALAKPQVDLAVERYRQAQVKARAEAIARTESLRNVHSGIESAFSQAIARGDIDADSVVKEWHHAGGGRYSRPDHVALDGETVKWGETFSVGDAEMKYPGDPAGGADQTVNCRCTVSHTLA